MPELPDLTVFAENLNTRFCGSKLNAVEIFNPKKCDSAATFMRGLRGQALREVKTIGKELFFYFENESYFSVHFMLKGGMMMVENHTNVKHKTAAFYFENQPILLFVDSMHWTKVLFEPLTDNIPDALKADISLEYLQKSLLRKRGIPIKGFLIDQKILKGIGNAYADEILYECKISPESFCEKLPADAILKLKEKIPATLQWGVNEIKKIQPNTISGEERSFLKVHNKEKAKTETGFPILVKEIAGKITYFTEEQVLYA